MKFDLKKNNQLVVLSGIFVLLATATIATLYIQTVTAAVGIDYKTLGEFMSTQAHSGNDPHNPANGNGVGGNSIDHSPDIGQTISTAATTEKGKYNGD